MFTVVIDKWAHKEAYPIGTFDPYHYSLAVLLNRIRGYLNIQHAQADVMAEGRDKREDAGLIKAYRDLRTSAAEPTGRPRSTDTCSPATT